MNDGGPAYPNPALANENFCPQADLGGMRMREYFAAQAIPTAFKVVESGYTGSGDESLSTLVAGVAFEIADAMVKRMCGDA